MATAANLITDGRYDLRDASSTLFTDAELLAYLNRALVQLDKALLSVNADWIRETDEDTDLYEDDDYVDLSSSVVSIRSVWIGSNQIIPKSVDYIDYKRKHISSQGQPDYYAMKGETLIFEREADQKYSTLVIHYNKKSAVLATTDDMPFNDRFNEPLRQMMVLLAKNRQELSPVMDSELFNFFMDSALGEVITRNYTPRRYRTDF